MSSDVTRLYSVELGQSLWWYFFPLFSLVIKILCNCLYRLDVVTGIGMAPSLPRLECRIFGLLKPLRR